ncbi:MAG TPA: pyridoxamine 5'-phosphate oxidase [Bryobacteraceae bacterium]|nr:pyridoxamine 5'-phosphate oxidase [Bryobacteraceae bacterium]
MDLADLRLSYTKAGLAEEDAARDPFRQFELWFNQALLAGMVEPNAMTLATAGASGQPNARAVLLKGFDEAGFVFYTNYGSRKSREIDANPNVCLLFYWAELERQVRIAGTAARVAAAESDAYFASRPVGHQLGAWVSSQSQVIPGRQTLEESLAAVASRFEPGPVPRPPHWGGFRVVPQTFEFWQGRPNRLHDRLEYVRAEDGWSLRRLSP